MVTYDVSQAFSENGNIFLFPYYPKESLLQNHYTQLVWAFKNENDRALTIVTQLAVQALSLYEQELRMQCPQWYMIVMPPHKQDEWNRSCEILCARLAMYYPWLIPISKALRRRADVNQSSMAKKERRPRACYMDHVLSISYEGPRLETRQHGLLLVDDVFTTGSLFHACYGILKDETGCDPIRGFFVGKSWG